MLLNESVSINGTEQVVELLSESILDNPNLGFYQLVYGVSLIIIIIIVVIKSQIYVRVKKQYVDFESYFVLCL